MIHYTCYISHEAISFDDVMLDNLLDSARTSNASRGITGILLYIQGSFIQYIEGDEKEVSRLYNTIKNDQRHKHVLKLSEGQQGHRSFNDWSMAFQRLSRKAIKKILGYNPIDMELENRLAKGASNSAIKLIQNFIVQHR